MQETSQHRGLVYLYSSSYLWMIEHSRQIDLSSLDLIVIFIAAGLYGTDHKREVWALIRNNVICNKLRIFR